MLHRFTTSISDIPLPERFTYPFCYTPHPLCVMAAEEVQHYLSKQSGWQEELSQGKMFGVLIVQTEDGSIGYLTSFSGILAGKNIHPYFVPPVYDLLQPQGFFKIEEENISAINRRIHRLEEDKKYIDLRSNLTQTTQSAQDALSIAKIQLKEAKDKRELLRKTGQLDAKEEADLIRESQFQKAEYKRLERSWKDKIASLQVEAGNWEKQIQELKAERKVRSAALQQQLFEQFRMLNYRGEVKTLRDIFEQTVHKTPPAGAGECAAPKLLQQAYLHHWKPIAMAEFWWGNSPKNEIRHHGYYYPACKGKCEPILRHMLQGLEVEANPMQQEAEQGNEKLNIVYEDQWLLIINKPAGMLSVPGKERQTSIYDLARKAYPEADGPMIVHRLDMATSGLLIIAKDKKTHQHLQAQFKNRSIRKKYIALLNGVVPEDEGTIELPLCPNPLDRPRQMVNTQYGKPAITYYQVLERTDKYTRIALYPHTGRTHQLRVHAAHPSGLHCPIIGDELYGKKDKRLYLHAESIEFTSSDRGKVDELTSFLYGKKESKSLYKPTNNLGNGLIRISSM